MIRTTLAAIAALFIGTGASQAATIFYEDFSDELAANGGNSVLNFTGFNQFSVTSGTVDLINSGDGYGITCLTGGACVDLDGSTGNAGTLMSLSLNLQANVLHTIELVMSGNQRGGAADSVTLKTDTDTTYTLDASDGFQTFSYSVLISGTGPQPFSFSLEHAGGDNLGIILDSVKVSSQDVGAVPLPASLPALVLALGGLAALRRRRS